MYDSRTAWAERGFATSWTTGYLATNTKRQVSDQRIPAGRSTKPKGWWGPPTHPHHGCTVVAGWGVDHHVPETETVALDANDGASRGKRRTERTKTISELTGVKSALTSDQARRIRDWC